MQEKTLMRISTNRKATNSIQTTTTETNLNYQASKKIKTKRKKIQERNQLITA